MLVAISGTGVSLGYGLFFVSSKVDLELVVIGPWLDGKQI